MRLRIGVENLTIDSAHYTLSSSPNSQIHGHTYRVNVEVEGDVDPTTGFVIDFDELKAILREIVKKWDHKLIVPRSDRDKISLSGPFRTDLIFIDAPYPTVEYIGMELAREIYERLGRKFKVTVKIYEGLDSYAVVDYP
ncbi:MAG: 6-pyruvoyl trahydropterin synthase family protein [Thermoprotei archaeon]